MKVPELREKLNKLNKDEVEKLAVEFYKLIPKIKKEDYNLDELINNPGKKQQKISSQKDIPLSEISSDVKDFIINARNQYYLAPNHVVPKKQRSKWRFQVKKWHKELRKTNRSDSDLSRQSKLLKDIYELLCESCKYHYFTAYDAFESVGVSQFEFLSDIIDLLHKAEGKVESLEKCIKLVINNSLNRFTLTDQLIELVISKNDIPDLKNKGIEICTRMIQDHELKYKNHNPNKHSITDISEYEITRIHNDLVEFVVRFYLSLSENQKAIEFHYVHYKEDMDEEIKLYILIEILHKYQLKNEIKQELESKIKEGVKIRDSLIKLLEKINNKEDLPKYLN